LFFFSKRNGDTLVSVRY